MPIVGSLPVVLTNGTVADATAVMADLSFIASQVNGNAIGLGSPGGVPAGGSTGTVLVKNSNTDYDYSWSSPGVGLGWGRNVLINGNFERAQRLGETVSNTLAVGASTAVYQFDRWYMGVGAGQASTVGYASPVQAGAVFPGNVASIFLQRNSGQAGVGGMYLGQPLDVDQVNRLQGKVVTLSLRFSTQANWSATGLSVQFFVGTGAPAKRGGGFTGEVVVLSQNVATVANQGVTTVSFTSTGVVPAGATQGEVRVSWTPVGVAGGSDSINLGNIQLEVGSQFSGWDYVPAAVLWQQCQRYYYKTFFAGTAPGWNLGVYGITGSQAAGAVGQSLVTWSLPVRMRGSPTVTLYNPFAANGQIRDATGGADWSGSTANVVSEGMAGFYGTSPGVAGHTYTFHFTAEAEI